MKNFVMKPVFNIGQTNHRKKITKHAIFLIFQTVCFTLPCI